MTVAYIAIGSNLASPDSRKRRIIVTEDSNILFSAPRSYRRKMELKVPPVNSWLCKPSAMLHAGPSVRGRRVHGGEQIAVAHFDTALDRDWCELVRDVVALANSGGGTITIDCPPDQVPSDPNCPRTIDLAASDILHRLARYTEGGFCGVEVRAVDRKAVEVSVGTTDVPIAFTRAGVYADADEPAVSHAAFAAGTFYFRHNGASEPGTSVDMRAVLVRNLQRTRKRWLRGIRRVMSQPSDGSATKKPRRHPERGGTSAAPQPVRIVNDPTAPALQPQNVDHLYPWRQKDLVREINARLGRRALNSYDIQAVRRQHQLDSRPDFVFHLEGAGRRYSPAVVDWMMGEIARDPAFFQHARSADHEMFRLRRQRPR